MIVPSFGGAGLAGGSSCRVNGMAGTNPFAWAPKAGGGQFSWASKQGSEQGGADTNNDSYNEAGGMGNDEYNYNAQNNQSNDAGPTQQYPPPQQNAQNHAGSVAQVTFNVDVYIYACIPTYKRTYTLSLAHS